MRRASARSTIGLLVTVFVFIIRSSISAQAQERQAPDIRGAIARAFQVTAGDALPPDGGSHKDRASFRGFRLQPEVQRDPPHRFFDRTNITLTLVEVGAMLADGATTQHGLKKYPGSREGNPLARPFVNAGWPGMIAGGAMVVSGEMGLRWLLHRKGHHRWERWIPVFIIADSTIEAIHNAVVLNERRTKN